MRLRLVPDSETAQRALDVIAAVGADTIQLRYDTDEYPPVCIALAGWEAQDVWAIGCGFDSDMALVALARGLAQDFEGE